nr:trypsin-like peptidase domain-containing protein [Pseudonocardia sp. C8]
MAIGLAASAVLTLFTAPAGVRDPGTAGPGVTTTARALPTAPAARPAVVPGPSSFGPGVVTETTGAGLCTAGYVLTAGERTFLAQAAHCGGTGDETETDGCTSAAVPLGTPVTVRGSDRTVTGRLAWSSWNTMQARGETDPDTCAYNDFALVELPRDAAASTGSAVPFFGGPTAVRETSLPAGTPVYGLANAPGPGGTRGLTVRAGTVADTVGGGWGHAVYTMEPGVAGESGSPLLDGEGRAVGVLSSLSATADRPSIEYTDLGRALDYAARTDGPAGLTPATGPAFDPEPSGVDPRDLATPAGPGVTG